MTMPYLDFLTRVIDDGIAAAKKSYDKPDDIARLNGAVAGFEACRGLAPEELRVALETSGRTMINAHRGTGDGNVDVHNYWWFVCHHAEVEWVCNVVSAALDNSDMTPIIPPTARGTLKAAEILGTVQYIRLSNLEGP